MKILSSFIILFTLLAIGIKNAPTTDKSIATSSKVEASAESAKPVAQDEAKAKRKFIHWNLTFIYSSLVVC